MLSVKPWKLDAIVRLFVSVFVCMFTGSLIESVLVFFSEPKHPKIIPFLACSGGALLFFAGALFFLGRSWTFENLRRHFIGVIVCVYGGFTLGWLAAHVQKPSAGLDNATLKTLLAVLSFQGAALVLAHRFVREHQVGWTDAFGLKNNRRQALALGFFVMFSALPICWILQMLSVSALQHLHIEAPEQTAVKILRGTDTMLNRIVLGIAAIGIAPVAEEILFRGILYPAIKQSGFPRLAIWITSLLFGAIHLNLVTFIPLTLLALLLVWLYEKTDNLLACITLHSLFNAANFAMIYILPWLADRFPQLAPS